MSLRSALKLLTITKDTFKTTDGPYGKGGHSLTVAEDKLVLTINNGHRLQSFFFDEDDLDKDPQDFINELRLFIEHNIIVASDVEEVQCP